MFVRYFVEVDRPYIELEAALLNGPERWIPGLVQEATDHGEALLTEVGFGPPGRRVEKRVQIEFGTPFRFPSRLTVPMVWSPVSAESLFPSLDADIDIAPLGPSRTHLSLSARYRPPLGVFGRAIDRALLHRVAEATVKDFLDRAAGALALEPIAPLEDDARV